MKGVTLEGDAFFYNAQIETQESNPRIKLKNQFQESNSNPRIKLTFKNRNQNFHL